MDKDPVLRGIIAQLGDFGPYQLRQHLLHLLASFLGGIHMVSLSFTAATPHHRCLIPQIDNNENGSFGNLSDYIPLDKDGELEQCLKFSDAGDKVPCGDEYWYDPQYYSTSRTIEWNLVCDKEWMRSLLQSIYMIGVLIGAVTLGALADVFGRKPILCLSGILELVFAAACAFMPDYYSYATTTFFTGAFATGGAYLCGFVLSVEVIGFSVRTICGAAFSFIFAVGMMFDPFWAWIIKDVKILQIVYAAHSLLLIGHWWLIDESIRWLWGKGRKEEALKIAAKAAKINGKNLVTPFSGLNSKISNFDDQPVRPNQYVVSCEYKVDKPTENNKEAERQQANKQELNNTQIQDIESSRGSQSSQGTDDEIIQDSEKGGIIQLFRQPRLRLRTVIMTYTWFATSMGYYGLSFNVANLPGNPFLMFFLISLAEAPGCLILILFMDKTGRRSMTSFLLFVGGFACLFVPLLNTDVVVICLSMEAKVAVAGAFTACYVYSAELFPTAIRSSVVGITTMAARGAGTLAPQVILLNQIDTILPMIIFGAVAAIAAFLVLFIPETLHRPMPQTIEEGEGFGKGDTAFKTAWRFFRSRRRISTSNGQN